MRMDAHKATQGIVLRRILRRVVIVAILIIIKCICFPAFADPIYIFDGEFNLPIPSPDINDPYISKGWMEDAIIEVTEHIPIFDLDVRISITHTNVFDLQIFLESPFGTRICLNMYDWEKEFSIYPNYINTIFDDEAPISIREGEPPFTGRFRPIEPYELFEFDGEYAYGFWRLQIYDAYWWDTGTLDSFELIITAPEPATIIFLLLGVLFLQIFGPANPFSPAAKPDTKKQLFIGSQRVKSENGISSPSDNLIGNLLGLLGR